MFLFAFPLLGAAIVADRERRQQAAYGYGESTLGRIPQNLWDRGGFGLRGRPRSWRDDDPRFGYAGRPPGGILGMRGPTSSFRYPLPRPWEDLPPGWASSVPARVSRYGVDEADYDDPEEKAAVHFVRFAQSTGRKLLEAADGSDPVQEGEEGEVFVVLTGGALGPQEQSYLQFVMQRYGLSEVGYRQTPTGCVVYFTE